MPELMTEFDLWWESDERFALAHEDEKTQARAAWNAGRDDLMLKLSSQQQGGSQP